MNSKQQQIENLLNHIYNNEGDSYGIDYFGEFLYELEKYDFAEILACQVSFPLNYVLDFILSTPSLWANLSETDCIRIMSVLNPRPEPFSREIFDTGYIDIHFFCKYLRVNAIELFLQQEQFGNEDKLKILQYCSKISYFLFMDELDFENLDGDYLVHKNELEKIRLKLISSGTIKALDYTDNEFKEYIQRELKAIE